MATVKQMETGRNTVELARQLGVSKYTLYAWRSKHAKIETNEAYRLRQLEEENRRLKNLVADLSLDREVLKAVIMKNGWTT